MYVNVVLKFFHNYCNLLFYLCYETSAKWNQLKNTILGMRIIHFKRTLQK